MASSEAAQRRPPASQEAQLDLRTFLESIHAGLEAPSASSANDSSAQAVTTAPSLPASARVNLLDAQIDAVNAKLQSTLTDNKETIVNSGKETVRVHREVRTLWTQVADLENTTQLQVQDRIPNDSGLLDALAAYKQASEAAVVETSNLSLLTSLHAAVLSLETVEEALFPQTDSASTGTEEELSRLQQLATQAEQACAELGVIVNDNQASHRCKLSWLAKEPRPPVSSTSSVKSWQREAEEIDIPGVRLLGPRLRRALEELDRRRRKAQAGASSGRSVGAANGDLESDEEEGEDEVLNPADEVRKRARILLQSPHGWQPVTTIDVSSNAAGPSPQNPFEQPQHQQHLSPTIGSQSRHPSQFAPSASSDSGGPATCTISQRSLDLVKLAEDTLVQARKRAKQLSREIAGTTTTGATKNEKREAKLQVVAELLHALPDIFILHLALMPILHPQSIWSDPVRALQFANDCSHLSAQCVRLGYELLIASNVREELGRLMNVKFGSANENAAGGGAGSIGGMRKAVEMAAHGLEEVSGKTTNLGLRVLNRQVIKNSK